MSASELVIYEAPDGRIKIDVRLEDETVWLTQAQMAELYQVKAQNITMHLKNIYTSEKLSVESTCKEFLQVQTEGLRQVERQRKYYNLDAVIQLNGRELLTHAGKISHQLALDKSAQEFEKYKETQGQLEHEENLRELEKDIENYEL